SPPRPMSPASSPPPPSARSASERCRCSARPRSPSPAPCPCASASCSMSTPPRPATRSITSISTVPKGSAMTSRAEGAARPRALVVGTGLIGGSIALSLRQRGWRVAGLDADPERLAEAVRTGVIDHAGDDPEAQIVFVATPAAAVVGEVRRLLETPGRRDDAVVTDVSGVKTAIVTAASHPRFIGGHPMAGSEQIGLAGAAPDLFEGAVWVLTPTAETDLNAFDRLQGVVSTLGADVLVLSATDHDRL